MERNEAPLDPHDLLEQTGWIQELAWRLVVDTTLREDVAQQALLVALERRPSVLNLRAWLTRLVRNTAWEMNRSERRQKVHLPRGRAAGEEPQESPDCFLERAELQGRIALAVTGLKEPYRSTILQRYFGNRSAEEIARREGIPPATVRTRLKRGLDQLREQFREEQGSNRGAWLALLLPATATEGVLLPTASLLTAGGLTMKLATLLLGLVTVGLALLFVAGLDDDALAVEESGVTPRAPLEIADPPTPAAAAAPALPMPVEPLEARARVEASNSVIAGQVIDLVTREPVTSFRVVIHRKRGIGEPTSDSPSRVVNQRVTDPEGSFRFTLEEVGVYNLMVFSPLHVSASHDELEIAGSGENPPLLIELDPALEVSGRVLDDATGEPIEGAMVALAYRSRVDYLLLGEPERFHHAVTDEEGRFRLTGLDPKCTKIAAIRDDYAEAWRTITPGQDEPVVLRMKRGPRITGTVFDDAGEPKEGVWITLHGAEIPLERPLVSAADGTYRTAPVRPGTVELLARPPWGETDDSFGFSTEWEVAHVQDADVRVDFGVRTDYVRWRGVVFGRDGKVLPDATVFIHFKPTTYVGYERLVGHSRNATTDEQGRFEFRKLPLGPYGLSVLQAGRRLLDPDGLVVLETPGLHEQDIRLDAVTKDGSCRIRGIVVDEATEKPIETDERRDVRAMQALPSYRSWRTVVAADGTFEIDGLPEGETHVLAHTKGWRGRSTTIILREDCPVDDLRLTLSRTGTMRLVFTEFREQAPSTFSFTLHGEEEETGIHPLDERLPENGEHEISWPLRPGAWTIRVHLEELGSVERSFEITAGQVTDVMIRPDDLVETPPTVNVAGTLRRADGTPVADTPIYFWGHRIPGIADEDRSRNGFTNAEGEFEIAGFIPGAWGVRATIGTTNANFPDLVIPAGADDPLPLHLVLSGGRLIGTLFDQRTGNPLGDDAPPRWLFLGRVEGGASVCEIQNAQTGSAFEMDGIPEGDYLLTISARGYARYISEPIHHSGDGVLDLGRIDLAPCGTLELEVVDEQGTPVPTFHVYVGDIAFPEWQRHSIGEGRFSLSPIPLGKVTIKILADGYQAIEKELMFEPEAPTRERFVLPGR